VELSIAKDISDTLPEIVVSNQVAVALAPFLNLVISVSGTITTALYPFVEATVNRSFPG